MGESGQHTVVSWLKPGEGLPQQANFGVALQELSDVLGLLGRLLCGDKLVGDQARIPAMLEQAAARLRRVFGTADAPLGSKLNPGNHDCLSEALPDEPIFVLLGRDRRFAELVEEWAVTREKDVEDGLQPEGDMAKVTDARTIAERGEKWRVYRDGAWRR